MIKFGLKLWSNNIDLFSEASDFFVSKENDFIELYHNCSEKLDFDALEIFKKINIPVVIHAPNSDGFHEFIIGERQKMIWKDTLKLADYFGSKRIVLHSGLVPNFDLFCENLKKIDDPRIVIENMPGIDMYGNSLLFGCKIEDLKKVSKIKGVCFDVGHAITSANAQKISYKDFLKKCFSELDPVYLHISGEKEHALSDSHLNIYDGEYDMRYIKELIMSQAVSKEVSLVFETPKLDSRLANDLKNIKFFKNL